MSEAEPIQTVAVDQISADKMVDQLDEQAIIKELAGNQLTKLAKLYFADEKEPDRILHSDDSIDSKWRHAWFARLTGNLSLMLEENFIRNPRLIESIQTIVTIFASTQFITRLTRSEDIALANQTIKAVCEHFNFPLNPVAT